MEIWDNSNGLPQNAVFALEKDEFGYLWIATEEGLVRFDGMSPKIFDMDTYPIMQEQTYYTFFQNRKRYLGLSRQEYCFFEQKHPQGYRL